MKAARPILIAAILTVPSVSAFGQAFTFTGANLLYSENFDSMGSAGTTYPVGWEGARVGGTGLFGAPLPITVGNGGGNAGGVYNLGAAGSNERALGTLASGSTIPAIGASFFNNTGSTVVELDISAFAEQWRSGSSSTANEAVRFEYSFDATSVSTGAWTPVAELNLNEILTTTTAALPVDGDVNRTAITKKVIVSWNPGTSLWIRWRDEDNAGSDGTYAIDDLVFKVTTGSAPKSVVWNPPGAAWNTTDTNWLDGVTPAAFATGDTVTFNDAGLAAGSTVTVQAAGVNPGAVTVANTTGTYTFTGGAIGGSGTLTKVGAGTLVLQTAYANAISVQAGALITAGANLIADIAGLSIAEGARVELDAAGDTVGHVTLTGGELKANGVVTLNDNIVVNAAATASLVRGTLALGAANRTVNLVGGPLLNLEATVSGTTRLALTGTGTVNLVADNAATYSGNVQLNSGVTLVLGAAGSLGTGQFFYNSGTLTASTGATPLVITNPVSLGNVLSPPVIGAGRDFEFSGAWTFFGTNSKTLVVNDNTVISGTISGTGTGSALTVRGTGKLTIAGPNNSLVGLVVDGTDGGTLEFNGTVAVANPGPPVTQPPITDVVNGGSLTGSGTLGDLNVLAGTFAPGTPLDPTATFATGNFNLFAPFAPDPGGILQLQLGGTAAADHDRLNVTGTVTLGGTLALALTGGFTPQAADTFTLILNDGADAVTGEFAGLPEGAVVFSVAGIDFRINYHGGDGNDVTLALPEPGSATLLLAGLAMLAGRRRGARTARA